MNRYHLVHVTEFRYDGAVSESYNEVRLRPLDDERQSCLSFRLSVTPTSRTTSYQDSFGNWVYQFHFLPEHRRLKVTADSSVLILDSPAISHGAMKLAELDTLRDELREEFFDYVAPSGFVPHLPALRELVEAAETASGGSVAGFAEAASGLIHERFQYVKGATHVHSSIEDSIARGAGVCQDFAHLLLGVVRMRGLPARYVSGYMVPESAVEGTANFQQVVGGQASHAWAEIYLPTAGWIGLDPTLGGEVGSRHVRVGYGRDYNDVAPVRGVYRGHAGQRLSVDVSVRPTVDSEGCEQLDETVAGPPPELVISDHAQQQQQ